MFCRASNVRRNRNWRRQYASKPRRIFGPVPCSSIDRTHTFIQWLFPLAEPSLSSPGSPTLNADEIAALRGLSAVRENILNSADWYGAFLSRNPHWKVRYDHNHLRITRVIKSLRLLVDDVQPKRFRERVFQMLGEDHAIVGQKALEFWNKA